MLRLVETFSRKEIKDPHQLRLEGDWGDRGGVYIIIDLVLVGELGQSGASGGYSTDCLERLVMRMV